VVQVANAQAAAAAAAAAVAAAVTAEEQCIVNVWQNNLETEIAKLRDLVETYKYISMVCLPSLTWCALGGLWASMFQTCGIEGVEAKPKLNTT